MKCHQYIIYNGYKLSLKMQEVYQSCVRSAMSYGSKTLGYTNKKVAIMRIAERAMVRAMCRLN